MKSIIYGYKQYTTGHVWQYKKSSIPLSDAPGNALLLSHLKAAKNIQKKEELVDGRLVRLYRPEDFSYAKAWTKNTGLLLNCERQTVLDVLLLAESDRTIWLSFE